MKLASTPRRTKDRHRSSRTESPRASRFPAVGKVPGDADHVPVRARRKAPSFKLGGSDGGRPVCPVRFLEGRRLRTRGGGSPQPGLLPAACPCARREETSVAAAPGVRCWRAVAHRHSYAVVDVDVDASLPPTQWGLLLSGVVFAKPVASCDLNFLLRGRLCVRSRFICAC